MWISLDMCLHSNRIYAYIYVCMYVWTCSVKYQAQWVRSLLRCTSNIINSRAVLWNEFIHGARAKASDARSLRWTDSKSLPCSLPRGWVTSRRVICACVLNCTCPSWWTCDVNRRPMRETEREEEILLLLIIISIIYFWVQSETLESSMRIQIHVQERRGPMYIHNKNYWDRNDESPERERSGRCSTTDS